MSAALLGTTGAAARGVQTQGTRAVLLLAPEAGGSDCAVQPQGQAWTLSRLKQMLGWVAKLVLGQFGSHTM